MRAPVVVLVLVLVLVLIAPAVSPANTVDVDTMSAELTPRDAVGYRNGRKLKLQVVEIGWTEVEVATARAFLAMQAAAAQDGVELWIYSGFRSHEAQARLYQAWREGWGNKAARPGFSNHQNGRALDIYLGNDGAFDWLEANASRHGFKRTVTGEPWHWEYVKRPKKKKRTKATPRRRKR
jgi:LAS superfamily LD-carboxypeptidase LdcB